VLTRIKAWLKPTVFRSPWEADMKDELESHVAAYADDLVASGMDRSEAERRARAELGSADAFEEECREAVGLDVLDELERNLRNAVRTLRKNRAFTAAAVLTLGVSIGANTVVFSVVDAVLLRPLPYPAPERLGLVVTEMRARGLEALQDAQTGRTWEALRDGAAGFEWPVFSAWGTGVNLASRQSASVPVSSTCSASRP